MKNTSFRDEARLSFSQTKDSQSLRINKCISIDIFQRNFDDNQLRVLCCCKWGSSLSSAFYLDFDGAECVPNCLASFKLFEAS